MGSYRSGEEEVRIKTQSGPQNHLYSNGWFKETKGKECASPLSPKGRPRSKERAPVDAQTEHTR